MPISEQARVSPWSVRAILFVALLLPVWALGVERGERITRAIGAVPPFFGEELARFERVRPRLASRPTATLLLDRARSQTTVQRFFVAQYSLAPTVLSWAASANEVVGSHWKGESRLVLCALDDPAQQTAALAALEAGARRRGSTFAAEPIDAVLTLVRLGAE